MEKVFIIIPTYNERENIGSLLDRLETVFQKIPNYRMFILVFDSNSPDKTSDLVREYQKKYDNVVLLTEQKKSGLGSAYMQSMKYAYENLGADIIFEFDADGSHSPEILPEMMKTFDKGAEVVLGSRYVPGGSIPSDWGVYRRMLSVLGNMIARFFLSSKIKDYTTGFRGTRTKLLKKHINLLRSKNYAYKIQLIWLFHLMGVKIVELPIHFVDRKFGFSKLPKNNIIESLLLISYLRYLEIKRYLKVRFAGGVGMLLQITAFNLLRHEFHLVYVNIICAELAIISSFFLNNDYSFRDLQFSIKDKLTYWLKKFSLFNFYSLRSLFLQTIIIVVGVDLLGRGLVKENILLIFGIGIGSISNYKMYRYFIWNKSKLLLK